jgi:hypothetical protein
MDLTERNDMTLGKSLTTNAAVRRMALVTLAVVSMVILGVGSVSAAPIITAGNVPGGTDNVLFNMVGLQQDALIIEGVVNNASNSLVEFEGTETLHSNGGQARVEAFLDYYNSLLIRIPGSTFTKLVMNLNLPNQVSGSVSFLLDGIAYPDAFALGNGSNFFSIEDLDGISTLQFLTTVDVQDTRQIRIGGVAPVTTPVPEPSVWAMTLVGLAAVGLRARTRRT